MKMAQTWSRLQWESHTLHCHITPAGLDRTEVELSSTQGNVNKKTNSTL